MDSNFNSRRRSQKGKQKKDTAEEVKEIVGVRDTQRKLHRKVMNKPVKENKHPCLPKSQKARYLNKISEEQGIKISAKQISKGVEKQLSHNILNEAKTVMTNEGQRNSRQLNVEMQRTVVQNDCETQILDDIDDTSFIIIRNDFFCEYDQTNKLVTDLSGPLHVKVEHGNGNSNIATKQSDKNETFQNDSNLMEMIKIEGSNQPMLNNIQTSPNIKVENEWDFETCNKDLENMICDVKIEKFEDDIVIDEVDLSQVKFEDKYVHSEENITDDDKNNEKGKDSPVKKIGSNVELLHKCMMCPQTFTEEDDFKKHFKDHADNPFLCKVCGKCYGHYDELFEHAQSHRYKDLFECPHCHKKFKSMSSVNHHQKLHDENCFYECNVCKKRYTQRNGLIAHMTIHTGKVRFRCEFCNRRFARSNVYRAHVKKHNKGQTHECSNCKKMFWFKEDLVKHVQTHSVKIFVCENCNQGFHEFRTLRRHYEKHSCGYTSRSNARLCG